MELFRQLLILNPFRVRRAVHAKLVKVGRVFGIRKAESGDIYPNDKCHHPHRDYNLHDVPNLGAEHTNWWFAHDKVRQGMAVIHVKKMPEFNLGDDVVLLAADREGLEAFERALAAAMKREQIAVPLISGGVTHEFDVGGVDTRVDLETGHIRWFLPADKASEILDKIAVLKAAQHQGHHYVDIDSPADTLILSVDEYL